MRLLTRDGMMSATTSLIRHSVHRCAAPQVKHILGIFTNAADVEHAAAAPSSL